MNNNPAVTPLEDQRKQALEHYEEAAKSIVHYSSFVRDAILNYGPSASQQTAFAIKVLEEINFKVSTVIATKDEAITKAVLLEDLEETLQNKLNELKNK